MNPTVMHKSSRRELLETVVAVGCIPLLAEGSAMAQSTSNGKQEAAAGAAPRPFRVDIPGRPLTGF